MSEKDKVFLAIARQLGALSTCDRASVGAVITHRGRCVSWGYNGAPPGLPHCGVNNHGWIGRGLYETEDDSLEKRIEADRAAAKHLGCRNATHAEANALAFAARQGISTEGGTLYVTLAPCETCARLLIAAGIVRVVYDAVYRDDRGLSLLREAGLGLQIGA